jgi:SAM-dependent methyltransferase
VTTVDKPWNDAANARAYADFARRYPMYRLTSGHLVELARLGPAAKVVDLACGTGVSVEAVLAALGTRGSVVAVDESAAMLSEARSRITDERVTWVRESAENLPAAVPSGMDAVLCNSAFWQTDMPAAAAAARGALRDGGRLVFNVGARMLADRPEAREHGNPLIARMREIAIREHDWCAVSVPRAARQPNGPLSEAAVRDMLAGAAFTVDEVRELRYPQSLEERYAWLTVPVFARRLQRLFGGLSYAECMALLAAAYRDVAASHPEPVTATWVAFAATAEPAGR